MSVDIKYFCQLLFVIVIFDMYCNLYITTFVIITEPWNNCPRCRIGIGRHLECSIPLKTISLILKHEGYLVDNKLCSTLPGVHFQRWRQGNFSLRIFKKWLQTNANKVNMKYRNTMNKESTLCQ